MRVWISVTGRNAISYVPIGTNMLIASRTPFHFETLKRFIDLYFFYYLKI